MIKLLFFVFTSIFAFPQVELKDVKGRVEYNPQGSLEWFALADKAWVEHNTTVRTSKESLALFCFTSKQCFRLDEKSGFLYNYSLLSQVQQYERSLSGFFGSGFFDFSLHKRSFAARLYAKNWVLFPENAKFTLKNKDGETKVIVYSGFVRVRVDGVDYFVGKNHTLSSVNYKVKSHRQIIDKIWFGKTVVEILPGEKKWGLKINSSREDLAGKVKKWLHHILKAKGLSLKINWVDLSAKDIEKAVVLDLDKVILKSQGQGWQFQIAMNVDVRQGETMFLERSETWERTFNGVTTDGVPAIVKYIPLNPKNKFYETSFLKKLEVLVDKDLWPRITNPFFESE